MFFGHFFTRHRRFASRVILFQTRHEKNVCHKHSALKTCLNADTHSQPALPPLLTVNLHPSSRRSFNLHPSHWQLTSPLPNQRSFSTPPAGSQIHPSQSSGHPLPLQLAVKFTPPRPAVILHPSWWPTSPLPAQRSYFTPPHPAVILYTCWRSTSPLPTQQSYYFFFFF